MSIEGNFESPVLDVGQPIGKLALIKPCRQLRSIELQVSGWHPEEKYLLTRGKYFSRKQFWKNFWQPCPAGKDERSSADFALVGSNELRLTFSNHTGCGNLQVIHA